MTVRTLAALLAAITLSTLTAPAVAQDEGGFALNQFQPAPAGDTFFSVPSPYTAGHLAPATYLMFDYAHRPIRRQVGDDDISVVSALGFLRLDASLALWDRLLVSLDLPLGLVANSEEQNLAGTSFTELQAPKFGDIRIGARVRALSKNAGPFQLGFGSYLYIPSGVEEQYTGDGAVRGAFHALAGGRVGKSVGFLYTARAGVELRGSDSPHVFTYGAALGLVFVDDMIQVGPEFYGVTALTSDPIALSSTPIVTAPTGSNAELLVGAKLRVLGGLTFGVGAGPGVGSIVGTPLFRFVGMVGWTPMPGPHRKADGGKTGPTDRDNDGINDDIDACPDKPGEPNPDPTKDGCPPADRDADGILDVDDACPKTPGLRNVDVTKNGCPKDTDGDGYHDKIDGCPKVPGEGNDDPAKNGCPPEPEGDGVVGTDDACPTAKGDPHDDPTKNGCPPDPDGDGIRWSADACPNEKGEADDDPAKNGCPRFVRVTKREIVISQRIEFETYGDELEEAVTPNSVAVLREVAAAIKQHPEFLLIEVQGHTDDSGTEEFNLDLSLRRAKTVRKWLISRGGINKKRLVAKGYGYNKPIADNRVKTGRQANRRVQFVVIKQGQKK